MTDSGFIAGLIFTLALAVLLIVGAFALGLGGHVLWQIFLYGWNLA